MNYDPGQRVAVENIPDFWERMTRAPSAFLALDYDGTLAPFHAQRMLATPLSGVTELLERIIAKTPESVAIVSGRTIAEIETLLPIANLILIGSHGFEIKRPGKSIIRRDPKPIQIHGIELARQAAEHIGNESLLEIKHASLALHTRGMSPLEAQRHESQISGSWNRIARAHDLEVRPFDGGIELRAVGWHKGDAVRELRDLLQADTFFTYIGDDETDEDVFRNLGNHGIGIRVGPVERFSAAQGRLKTIEHMRGFLSCWLELAPEGYPKGGRAWISAD